MRNLTTLISTDDMRCVCCGSFAQIMDERHGPLCRECLGDLAEIEDFLDAIDTNE
jgi:hypothetical protein